MYFISESNAAWSPINASNLSAAKRAAGRAQMFQGTDMFVGVQSGGSIKVVASKLHRDALNMSAIGKWQDVA